MLIVSRLLSIDGRDAVVDKKDVLRSRETEPLGSTPVVVGFEGVVNRHQGSSSVDYRNDSSK